jgi:hypothetical protein
MADDPLNIPGIPGSEEARPQREIGLWIELAGAIALGVFFTLLTIGLVNVATSPNPGNRLSDVIGASVCVGVVVLCAEWAIHTEHRLRRHDPVAAAYAALPGTAPPRPQPPPAPEPQPAALPPQPAATPSPHARPAPPPQPAATPSPQARSATAPRSGRRSWAVRTGRRRRRRYGPLGTGLWAVAFFVGGVVSTGLAVTAHQDWKRSSYVQQHGIPAVGTVISVVNHQTCGRYSCSYTSDISTSLAPPVAGTSVTDVHYPYESNLAAGQRFSLLVDPRDPGYAEVPGSEFTSSIKWVLLALFAVFLFALSAQWARSLWRMTQHRRDIRASA